jgi:hypothetical protein
MSHIFIFKSELENSYTQKFTFMIFRNSDEKQITEKVEVNSLITLSRPNNIQELISDILFLSASSCFRFFMAVDMAVYSRQPIHACALDYIMFRELRFGSLAFTRPQSLLAH